MPEGSYNGFYSGIVEDNKDPDCLGRLKVRIAGCNDNWNLDDIKWAEPCFPFGGYLDQGFFMIPEIGSYVIVAFIEGSQEKPIWLGCHHKKETNKPPCEASLEANEFYTYRKQIKTPTGYIMFDDKEMRMYLVHKSGSFITFDENGDINFRAVNNINMKANGMFNLNSVNQNIMITAGKQIGVSAKDSVNLKSENVLTMHSDGSTTLTSDKDFSMKSVGKMDMITFDDLDLECVKSMNLKIGQNWDIKSKSHITIKTDDKFKLESATMAEIYSHEKMNLMSNSDMSVLSETKLDLAGNQDLTMKSNKDLGLVSPGNLVLEARGGSVSIKSKTDMTLFADGGLTARGMRGLGLRGRIVDIEAEGGDLGMRATAKMYIRSNSDMYINSKSRIYMKAPRIDLN